MKFYVTFQALQVASAVSAAQADAGLVDFGRALRSQYSPIERLRHASSKSSKVLFVEEEIEVAAELAAQVATSIASKTGKRGYKVLSDKASGSGGNMPLSLDDSRVVKSAKASKVFKSRSDNLSYDFVMPKSAKAGYLSYDYLEVDLLSKSSKADRYFLSYDFDGIESKSSKATSNAMSYDFAGSFADVGSMAFEFADDDPSFGSPTMYPTTTYDDVLVQTGDEVAIDQDHEEIDSVEQDGEGTQLEEVDDVEGGLDDFGRLVFEYLSQCSGAGLNTDSCLASGAIFFLTSVDVSDEQAGPMSSIDDLVNSSGQRRFLQALNEDECMPPEIEESFLSFIVGSSRAQCEGIEMSVADAEFDEALTAFSTIFDSESCWASLCGESSNPSDLFFKILFAEAARCADVMMDDIPECLLNEIFSVIFASEDSNVGRVRRVLQESSCEQPSATELGFFVTFLLTEAEQTCAALNANVDASDLDSAFDSLVKIFGASHCWGVDECGEDDAPNDDDWWATPVVVMDGTRCDLDSINVDTRAIELSYYYLLETVSSNEDETMLSIEGIERSLITYVCSVERRRSLEEMDDTVDHPNILAVDSNPLDTISTDYACESESSSSQACYVIEGTLSLLVPSSQDISLDDALKSQAYQEELAYTFSEIRVDDSNVVSIKYVGSDVSSLSSLGNKDPVANANMPSSPEDSDVFTSILIGVGGSLVVMGALIAGAKKVEKNEDPIHPSGKAIDDGSEAQQTSDLTYSNSLEDESSISPTNRYCSEQATIAKNSMTKHFILAEEEEANWYRLGINHQLEVYEEDVVEEQSI